MSSSIAVLAPRRRSYALLSTCCPDGLSTRLQERAEQVISRQQTGEDMFNLWFSCFMGSCRAQRSRDYRSQTGKQGLPAKRLFILQQLKTSSRIRGAGVMPLFFVFSAHNIIRGTSPLTLSHDLLLSLQASNKIEYPYPHSGGSIRSCRR